MADKYYAVCFPPRPVLLSKNQVKEWLPFTREDCLRKFARNFYCGPGIKDSVRQENTRSLGQILEKLCVRTRGHIFSLIIMKLYQNVCLEEISDKSKNGSCQVKN